MYHTLHNRDIAKRNEFGIRRRESVEKLGGVVGQAGKENLVKMPSFAKFEQVMEVIIRHSKKCQEFREDLERIDFF